LKANTMSNTALITGASAGIGREFARYHASKGGDLIITARRADALTALKTELETAHGISVTTIPQDLSSADHAKTLYAALNGTRIDVLINNAGFGGHGKFIERDLSADLDMIDLNINALVTLCHLVGGDMAKQGAGKILNVSSTAAHMPGPLQATYFATKAFVSSFSQAIADELKGTGVTVTALEPGPVATEFFETANLTGTKLGKDSASAADVAKIGYDAMLDGKLTIINDPKLRFALGWLMPFMPTKMKLKFVRDMQEKS
jgi:short-subunit dehydrogenase